MKGYGADNLETLLSVKVKLTLASVVVFYFAVCARMKWRLALALTSKLVYACTYTHTED